MLDVDTFLTWLCVIVDEWVKREWPPAARPGPAAALSPSEVLTLAVFGEWAGFPSERAFHRYARRRLRAAFPTLPERSRFNRCVRAHWAALAAFGHALAAALDARTAAYQALDAAAVPVRNRKRRGSGWLPGTVAIGWSSSLGWYEGFALLAAVTPTGAVAGYGVAAANVKEQRQAEAFLAARRWPHPALPTVGPRADAYLADAGFAGEDNRRRWRDAYGAVVTPPQSNSARPWPAALADWLRRHRQVAETAFAALLAATRLRADRPHALDGFQARLAATIALHNFCLWLNAQLGRRPLAFADLVAW